MDLPARRWKVADDDGIGTVYDVVDYGPVKGSKEHPIVMFCEGRLVWSGHRVTSGFRTDSTKLGRSVVQRLLPLMRDGEDAVPASDDEAVFLTELEVLARGEIPGTLFSIAELRAQSTLPKARFDRAALGLSRKERVTLHHHDHPFALSESSRAALVFDPRHDVYYVGIAPRRPRA